MGERNVKLTLKANMRAYVAGVEMARAKTSPTIKLAQQVVPLPVWWFGWTQVNDRPRKRVFRFAWVFRGRRLHG